MIFRRRHYPVTNSRPTSSREIRTFAENLAGINDQSQIMIRDFSGDRSENIRRHLPDLDLVMIRCSADTCSHASPVRSGHKIYDRRHLRDRTEFD